MEQQSEKRSHLDRLNQAQRDAVLYGLDQDVRQAPPLLIIAGAGTGKTLTLAHRVAELVLRGVDPQRILLLTFSRRAAAELGRRAERIVAQALRLASEGDDNGDPTRARRVASLRWAGTFHGVANRLLRRFGPALELEPSFTVLDRSDAEDLMDLLRQEAGLAAQARRFPRKATCLAIYSRCVNASEPIEECLETRFPWCAEWKDELRALFQTYAETKAARAVLDYDDLLLYWFHLMGEPALALRVGEMFDHVLVDEYQDTNRLQAAIVHELRPACTGVSVVGDDAQAIYAFRAATVRNILDFPDRFEPPARVITLEQNYRSTQPILAAANAVIDLAPERFCKSLYSDRGSREKPRLVAVEDEHDQACYVTDEILAAREAGVPLQRQAVLFRTAHHSDLLEVELGRRNVPYVKYGGLKFLEAAHIKDLLGLMRWAENARDSVAAFRTMQLLPGIGPAASRRALECLEEGGDAWEALETWRAPAAAAADWPSLRDLLADLAKERPAWPAQVGAVRRWLEPHLERLYDNAGVRAADLEQLEQIAGRYPGRERFLSELTIDPPQASGDHAVPPHLDEDYLILSTIHSAKGQEWDNVYVLNLVDGCIPSDMATGSDAEIEEERRLLYVAMTRARRQLQLVHPLRFYVTHQRRLGSRHVYAPLSRFLPEAMHELFDRRACGRAHPGDDGLVAGPRIDVAARLRDMWSES